MSMNLSWSEIYNIVRELTNKIETQKKAQKTIPRVNLKTLLQIMINFDTFTYDKKISFKITGSNENITLKIWRK